MSLHVVPIDKITTDRPPSDRVPALMRDILKNGLRVPLLVTEDYRVVDGRDRLAALAMMRADEVSVVVAETFDEALSNLTAAYEHRNHEGISARQVWEVYQYTRELSEAERAVRNRLPRAEQIKNKLERKDFATQRLARAMKFKAGIVQSTAVLYKSAKDPSSYHHEVANQILPQVEAGTMSVYAARHVLYSAYREKQRKAGMAARDQARILDRSLTTMDIVMRALTDVGDLSHDLSTDDLDRWFNQMKIAHTQIYRLKQEIRKLKESKVSNE